MAGRDFFAVLRTMFFIVSKILSFLISPLTWIVFLFAVAVFAKKAACKQKSLKWGFACLIFFTNPFFFNVIMGWWELPATKINDVNEHYEVCVMLGGTIRYMNSEMSRPVFGQAADRYLQSIELLANKKVKKVILSSGSGSILYKDAKEADFLKAQMLRLGIDSNLVIAESNSKNTYENAVESAKILKQQNINGEVLLVTSAFHMRRAIRCFNKQGVKVVPYCVDQRSGKQMFTPDKLFIPDTEKLADWNLLIHEWFGFLTYKVSGYI